jgi:hypothetical protein
MTERWMSESPEAQTAAGRPPPATVLALARAHPPGPAGTLIATDSLAKTGEIGRDQGKRRWRLAGHDRAETLRPLSPQPHLRHQAEIPESWDNVAHR